MTLEIFPENRFEGGGEKAAKSEFLTFSDELFTSKNSVRILTSILSEALKEKVTYLNVESHICFCDFKEYFDFLTTKPVLFSLPLPP